MRKQWDAMILWFLAYSVIGWVYEVFLEVVVYRWGYSDRGVLFGPYCPVYGVGALAFLLCLGGLVRSGRPLWQKVPAVFLGSMAVATAIELAASYLLEWTTGSWPWQTYADYAVNFQARIALSPSVRFGIGGVVFLFFLQPLLRRATDALGPRRRRRAAVTAAAVLAADFALTVALHL